MRVCRRFVFVVAAVGSQPLCEESRASLLDAECTRPGCPGVPGHWPDTWGSYLTPEPILTITLLLLSCPLMITHPTYTCWRRLSQRVRRRKLSGKPWEGRV